MVTVENTVNWLKNFADKIETNKAYLSDLDRAIGDGDHGNNMARGVQAMVEKLDDSEPTSVQAVLKTASMALLSKIGGASGPLYGTALLEMSKQAKEDQIEVRSLVEAGLAGIQKRGKAEVGEKTMVDLWAPVLDHLNKQTLTKEAIDEAVNATKDLKATKGRASYVGDRSIGAIDPGAASSGYLFEAMIEEGVLEHD
ncbi:dihydroxyacetone kinase subunit DhaL [Paraliobacillus ryukyuensis]|uniref:dihydroxyacetone kinase subunit DhaL n=1 Tax=Paraliobacillus ryukyuensis TaxID=200904 RepID=UPI0009A77AA0|nr:dihydroxyacetone kinase subunit DhaL [Paraliobacillus ryukyuensis]